MIQPSTSKPLHPHGWRTPIEIQNKYNIYFTNCQLVSGKSYDIIVATMGHPSFYDSASHRTDSKQSRKKVSFYVVSCQMDLRLDLALRRHCFGLYDLDGPALSKEAGRTLGHADHYGRLLPVVDGAVSDSLIRPLEMAYEQPSLEALDGDVIIVLGGGSRAGVPDVDGVGKSEARRQPISDGPSLGKS